MGYINRISNVYLLIRYKYTAKEISPHIQVIATSMSRHSCNWVAHIDLLKAIDKF